MNIAKTPQFVRQCLQKKLPSALTKEIEKRGYSVKTKSSFVVSSSGVSILVEKVDSDRLLLKQIF